MESKPQAITLPSYESIRSFMDIPRERNTLPEPLWHDIAPQVFIESYKKFPEEVAKGVGHLIETYPYSGLDDLLENITQGDIDEKTITELRFMRKVMMIGRDTVRLATTIREDKQPFKSMDRLVNRLGRIVDSIERTPGRSINKASNCAFQKAAIIKEAQWEELLVPVTLPTLYSRVEDALLSDYLLAAPQDTGLYEKEYHHARRLFRSVVHLGIVSHLISPNNQKAEFAKAGIELSASYGSTHDMLVLSDSM